MAVKKIKQRITGWLRHPSVAVVIGCIKIGEGIRTSLEAAGFLRAWIPGWMGEGVLMGVQVAIYSAMLITAAFAIVAALLAVRSKCWEVGMARQQPRRAGTLWRGKR